MDLYLPADYLRLREDIDDWRDAPQSREIEMLSRREPEALQQTDSVDPSWRPL